MSDEKKLEYLESMAINAGTAITIMIPERLNKHNKPKAVLSFLQQSVCDEVSCLPAQSVDIWNVKKTDLKRLAEFFIKAYEQLPEEEEVSF